MNTIYMCCLAEPWVAAIKHLELQGIIPKYYVGWRNDEDVVKKAFLKSNIHYQNVDEAWKGRGFPAVPARNALDESSMKLIAFEQLVGMKMMDRLDPAGCHFSFSSRALFLRNLITTWLDVIDEFDISLVVSPSIPHRVFDYALYVACQMKDVKFLSFQMTPFSDGSFILDSVEATPAHLKKHILSDVVGKKELCPVILERIERVGKSYEDAVPDYMINQERRAREKTIKRVLKKLCENFKKIRDKDCMEILRKINPFAEQKTYYVRSGSSPENSLYSRIALRFYMKRLLKIQKKFVKIYKGVVTEKELPKRYVFVALHYQPEETSCPTGGFFCDQEAIIQFLDKHLPDDVDIVVKEHKSQLFPNPEAAAGRDLDWYNRVAGLSNRIMFRAVDEDPFFLIDNALATCTISGTIGWESVLRKRPAIIFGRAWYEDMLGVFKVKNAKDFKNAWNQVASNSYSIKKNDILGFHEKLQEHLIFAGHYKTSRRKSIRSNAESAKNISNGIIKYLKSNAIPISK